MYSWIWLWFYKDKTHTENDIKLSKTKDSPLYKYLLKGMNGNGGQKNGTFVTGCNGGWGGDGVNWDDEGAEADAEAEVEEPADWDDGDGDVDIPLPVVAGAGELLPAEPESKKNHFNSSFLTQSNVTSTQ